MAFNNGNPRDKGPIVIGPNGGNTSPRPKDPVATNPPKPKDPVATNPPKPKDPTPVAVANAGPGAKPTMVDPKFDPAVLKPRLSHDPKRRWSEAIAWTVTDPGLIVASAEFLMEMDEYKSAVEVLKGGLRKGLTTDTWAHDALALALQESQASSVEYERAALSAIDLDPTDSKAYLKAAQVAAQMKNHDLAMAFSKRAAAFAPDQPVAYANTLAFAEHATDVKTDAVVWAARNLLKRDWTDTDGIDYHAQTKTRLEKLITKLNAAGQKTDDLRKALAEQTQRDLVIELLWQGQADLDLIVAEPCGSVCSTTTRRTTGGGVMQCDILEQTNDRDRSEQYVAALAFKGTYKVTVKQAFGKPIGGTATLKVTRFKGTAKESHDLITVDLDSSKPVEIQLDGGSRTELATITDNDDDLQLRATTTGATLQSNATGFGGGFGSAGSLMSSPHTTTTPTALPVVNAGSEARLPGIGSSAADLRASLKVNPDRQTFRVEVKPVFGTGKDVTMPKVPLLPGGEGR
jgi:tetratricopeptide (TPR) repeat protein